MNQRTLTSAIAAIAAVVAIGLADPAGAQTRDSTALLSWTLPFGGGDTVNDESHFSFAINRGGFQQRTYEFGPPAPTMEFRIGDSLIGADAEFDLMGVTAWSSDPDALTFNQFGQFGQTNSTTVLFGLIAVMAGVPLADALFFDDDDDNGSSSTSCGPDEVFSPGTGCVPTSLPPA